MGFRERIRGARKAAGLTQRQLSELVGVHVVTATKWESQGTLPGVPTIERIADALGVHFLWLSQGEGPMARRSRRAS